jgi:hypothetical protein
MNDSERIAALEKEVAQLKARQSQIRRGLAIALGLQPTLGTRVATDEELDGPEGDPKISKDPSKGTTEHHVGRTYSQTSPEYLLAMAKFQDWCAEKELADPAKKKYARLSAQRAALARGWAARLKAQGPRPEPDRAKPKNPYEEKTPEGGGDSDRSDIPF